MNALETNTGAVLAAARSIPDQVKPPKPPSALELATSLTEENLAVLRKRIGELERVLQPLLVDPMPSTPDTAKPETEAPPAPFVSWMRSHAREIANIKTHVESLIGRLQL